MKASKLTKEERNFAKCEKIIVSEIGVNVGVGVVGVLSIAGKKSGFSTLKQHCLFIFGAGSTKYHGVRQCL